MIDELVYKFHSFVLDLSANAYGAQGYSWKSWPVFADVFSITTPMIISLVILAFFYYISNYIVIIKTVDSIIGSLFRMLKVKADAEKRNLGTYSPTGSGFFFCGAVFSFSYISNNSVGVDAFLDPVLYLVDGGRFSDILAALGVLVTLGLIASIFIDSLVLKGVWGISCILADLLIMPVMLAIGLLAGWTAFLVIPLFFLSSLDDHSAGAFAGPFGATIGRIMFSLRLLKLYLLVRPKGVSHG